jgi:hypothetical protein
LGGVKRNDGNLSVFDYEIRLLEKDAQSSPEIQKLPDLPSKKPIHRGQ